MKWYADETDRVHMADNEWRVYHRDHPGRCVYSTESRTRAERLADYLNRRGFEYDTVSRNSFIWWRYVAGLANASDPRD